jgi:hypothetical protein
MCKKETIDLLKDVIVPVFTVLISVVAIIFTYIGLSIQRKHNHKSLKPIGKIRSFNYENNISLRIDNYGTGPLIIKSIFVNGEDIGSEKGIIDYIPNKFADSLGWRNYTGSYPGRAIPPNENLELLAWSPTNYKKNETKKMESDKKKLRKILKDMTVKVVYMGIYENEIFTDEMKLTWYGNNF